MAETGNGGIKPGSGSMKTSNQATTMLTHTGGEDFEYGQWNEIWLDLSRTDVSGGSNLVDELHWHVYYSDETTPVHIDWDHIFVTDKSFTKLFYHNDYLGSARLMTDEGGDIVWARDYRPYGDERNNSGNDDNPYKFTGKERDEEIGLDYSWHRYYDYELGRFTQIDPMSAKYPGLSPYLYCADNPILYTDPDGKDFGIYVHEHGAGGNGHTTLYFQNGEGQWFTYDQGARDNNPSLISAATLGVSAGVTINQVDRLPQGAIRVKTSIEQDKLITQSALKSQIDHKTGEKKYQLSSNNCTDAAVDVINDSGTGIELENPWNIIKPNTWFKYLKSLKKQYGETEGEGIDETSVKLEGDKYEVVH